MAVEFGKQRPVLGFDINAARIAELQSGQVHILEVSTEELAQATHLSFSSTPSDLRVCQVFIVAVPTPVDQANRPDLPPLVKASETVGKALKAGSGLKFNQDFFCGYSPERINPGDKEHRLPSIKKLTSGSTPEVAQAVDQIYKQIITAGTHQASSIKLAEAAMVIENTQRDVNIALMNELSLIFGKLGIDTLEVLQAAGTKWNFCPLGPAWSVATALALPPIT